MEQDILVTILLWRQKFNNKIAGKEIELHFYGYTRLNSFNCKAY